MALSKKDREKFMSHPFVMAVSQSLIMLRYSKVERPALENDFVTVISDPKLWKSFENTILQAYNWDARFRECYPELLDDKTAHDTLNKQLDNAKEGS